MRPASPAERRGNALPETALVMPLLLLVVYGLVEIALAAFYQISADGASFVGAQKSVALQGASASLSSARSIATTIFSHVGSANVGVATPGPSSTSSAVFEANVSQRIGTIGVPGFSSTLAINSRTIEPGVGSTTSLGPINFCSKSSGTSPVFSLANTVNGGAAGVAPIVNESTGAVNLSAMTAHVADLQNVSSGLSSITAGLNQLNSVLAQVAAIPLVGSLVQGVLNTALSAIQPVLNAALTGTSSGSSIAALTSSLNLLLAPIERALSAIGQSGLASQLTASVTTLTSGLSVLNAAESDLNLITGAVC